NRAGLALPEDMVSPAIDGWAAILPTFAWVVAAVQVLTLGAGYAPWGDVLAALLILALIVWPHSAPFAALTHGARVYGAAGRVVPGGELAGRAGGDPPAGRAQRPGTARQLDRTGLGRARGMRAATGLHRARQRGAHPGSVATWRDEHVAR